MLVFYIYRQVICYYSGWLVSFAEFEFINKYLAVDTGINIDKGILGLSEIVLIGDPTTLGSNINHNYLNKCNVTFTISIDSYDVYRCVFIH
jgi:hypothetical protein